MADLKDCQSFVSPAVLVLQGRRLGASARPEGSDRPDRNERVRVGQACSAGPPPRSEMHR